MSRYIQISVLAFLLPGGLFAQQPVASREARKAPGFLRRAAIYQIWLRSFSPEGTLKAVTARLPYIAGLGATIVYLTPIMRPSPASFGGYTSPYRLGDLYAIDPELGTDGDLKTLVNDAHRLRLKVILDVVFYHTGPDSALLSKPEFYMHTPDGKVLLGRYQLPRLNVDIPEVREYLIGNLVYWVKTFGVDGFRCDVAGSIPLSFWEQARAELDKINPDLIMLAESDLPESQLKAFDLNYNFAYYRTLDAVLLDGEPASRLRAQWEKARATYPRGARLLHLSDNHDRQRVDVMYGYRGALATAILNFTLDGVPFVYNGQEIADTTPTHHPSHAPIRWHIDLPKGRYPSRASLLQEERLRMYKRLFQLRAQEPALTAGEVLWIDNSQPGSVVSFLRRHGGDEILVVVNLSNRKCTGTMEVTMAQPSAWRKLIEEQAKVENRAGYTGAPDSPTANAGPVAAPGAPRKAAFSLDPFGFLIVKRVGPPPTGAR